MALDEPKEKDRKFTDENITFIIDKELFERVKPIEIDFVEIQNGSGFSIKSSLPPACGGCCS
ncbi:MAG TPA: hypothetical protein PK864_01955 [Syntrophorhabdaceae bacterium]|nr:hypothetical protein [Syntrophorhabdaceae bacterium]HOL06194.1 hypothetical protein [Syntrophorhabdaceae bacterium]HON84775.1 hypothetical protein [Syntrophorhabdaceae bacterium]HOT41838.1 hypothetical protein [Syntrophorhabdaceae bacterium]HPP40995.1 hypothetical protein [Syntrophorhabdaceae bacterium]